MLIEKCGSINSGRCLSEDSILNGGGNIIKELDGTLSVWVNTDNGLLPYIDINTKSCCEFIGYTFDIDKQRCLWSKPIDCDDCIKKIVINPNGDDGEIFFVSEENEVCELDINLDYLIELNCDSLQSGSTTNPEIIDIRGRINQLEETLKLYDCDSLESVYNEYLSIYDSLCYPIKLVSNENGLLVDKICCLSDVGLVRWQSILGDIRYNIWLNSDGCDDTLYTIDEAKILLDEGNSLAIDNGNINPYLLETNDSLCSKKQINDLVKSSFINYQECLDTVNLIEGEIEILNEELLQLSNSNCEDPINNIENFNISLTLDVETSSPGIYETVYEEILFTIGEDNLINYIINNTPLTGLRLVDNNRNVLPNITLDDTCDYTDTCEIFRDEFINRLYIEQYLPLFGEPIGKAEISRVGNILGGWYNSDFIKKSISITDTEIIDSIKNKKIKLSLKVNNCCLDFSILLDNISLNKTCTKEIPTFIKIDKPIGFNLKKTVDNKKSWLTTEINTNRVSDLPWRETSYLIKDSRLVINTKEIDLNIDSSRAIENDIFNYIKNNPCILDCSPNSSTIEHNLNIDFNSILLSQFNDGIPYDCQITINWGISASLDGEIVYDNPIFYSSTTISDVPTINDYINELIILTNQINIIFIYDGDLGKFILNDSCFKYGELNLPFKINLTLDIELCENKQFEDSICMDFEDGEPYEFEGEIIDDNTINNYVEDDFVEDYFE
jgi:hypothetical protein